MTNIYALVNKLIKALKEKYGIVLLLTEERKQSEKREELVYSEYRLVMNVSVEYFNEMHPNFVKNPNLWKSRYAPVPLLKCYKLMELFGYVKEIWEKAESGELYEEGERYWDEFRSRYNIGRSKRAGGRKRVLQDALVGKELPYGFSEYKQKFSKPKGAGDTAKA